MEAGLTLRTDTMGDLTIIEGEGGPGQTAHGVMADLVAIAADAQSHWISCATWASQHDLSPGAEAGLWLAFPRRG